jgi:uncharacterized protein YdhG (YjbR/CyaY superfamily)
MQYHVNTVQEYLEALPIDRKDVVSRLREVILKNIPEGFSEEINYEMIGYVVPHSLYPSGYHCDPKLPLPFLSIASQKNFIAIYHMGIFGNPKLLEWFITEYSKHVITKLDMGKSCIRFKNPKHIPYELLAELCRKMTPQEWIELYEKNIKRG